MGIIKGGLSRLGQTGLYFLAFCCAAIIVGIYSYFIAALAKRDVHVKKQWKAVEGISAIAVLYTLFATTLTCCLGGISFFALTALALDLLIMGGFIAIAVLTREGAKSCNGRSVTPLNINSSGRETYASSYGTACKLNKAVFALAIAAAALFFITALFQLQLMRTHKKEKQPRGFFARRRGQEEKDDYDPENAPAISAPTGGLATVHHHRYRPSNDTAYTGSTAAGSDAGAYRKVEKVEQGHDNLPIHHPQPNGTAPAVYTGSTIAAPIASPNAITHETGFGANHTYHTQPVNGANTY